MFSKEWLINYENRRRAHADQVADKANRIRPACAKPEPIIRNEPLVEKEAEGRDPRRSVTITSYRVRLLDPDNLCIKYHIDGLRYKSVIRDDTNNDIEIFARQVKVKTRKEERTEIEVKQGD